MTVRFTRDVERERAKRNQEARKSTWEILKTTSMVEALHKARELGWKENKVQVRAVRIDESSEEYYVEPYEEGCGCRGILKYRNYFD